MNENKTFWIRYSNNRPVKIHTHFHSNNNPNPLSDVADLVEAYHSMPGSLLANTDLGCNLESAALKGGLPLSLLTSGNTEDTALIINVINQNAYKTPLKRTKSAISSVSRGSNGTDLNQQSFRDRVLDRDNGCMLTGKEDLDCDACHIISYTYFQKNNLVGKEIFDTIFPPNSCDNPEHRVMDVRNGILMWSRLNAPFDKLDFTIIKRGDEYIVETLQEHEFPVAKKKAEKKLQLEIMKLNGKRFSFDPAKRNEWPGENFLKFHNKCFYKKREEDRIKAQAEALEMEEDDSAQTISVFAETNMKVNNWDLSNATAEDVNKIPSNFLYINIK
ncbi:hypothetical protein HDV01_006090 [Terramyces sp. JEL0728]|nr:hypothetical protein HDV01_006090 [Terramyces sp. JEL0728]